MKFKYSILLPTYNERENIAVILYLIFKFCVNLSLEVIVVEDNSPDGTADVLPLNLMLHSL